MELKGVLPLRSENVDSRIKNGKIFALNVSAKKVLKDAMHSPAFVRKLKALQPRGWQSTAEGLPNDGDDVLYRTAEHQAMGKYEGMNRWIVSNGEVEEGAVLLWQPL